MRRLETAIRKQKDVVQAARITGDGVLKRDAQSKITDLTARYKQVAEASGLKARMERTRTEQQKTVENAGDRGIINERNMAMGMRQPASHILTEDEISSILRDAEELGIDRRLLHINTGIRTGFSEVAGAVNIRGDILPDMNSKIARDRMSQRAVLAHEYYGHYQHNPSEYKTGDWRDEFRASYDAAVKAPNLSPEDRGLFMIDAYDRAREAGEFLEYDAVAKRLIYGYYEID